MFGTFDYQEMVDVSPIAATIWFWSFIIINVFVILNLLTALVYDHYTSMQQKVNFR
jgi:hypothetical protein